MGQSLQAEYTYNIAVGSLQTRGSKNSMWSQRARYPVCANAHTGYPHMLHTVEGRLDQD